MIVSLTLKSILYTFKHIWHLDDYAILDELLLLSQDLFDDSAGVQLIQKLLVYIYAVKDIEPEKMKERINLTVANNKGDIAMTTAEILMEKGMEKGIKEGKTEDARRMKEDNMPFEKISKYTGLSIEEIEKL